MGLSAALAVLSCAASALGAVTVYGNLPLGQTRLEAPWQTTTLLAAYNYTKLPIPRPPDGDFARQFTIQLRRSPNDVEEPVSIPHVGHGFWGFSLETSIVSQVVGKNSSQLRVPFLNLLANLEERSGGVVVRIGGNTQEYAIMVEPDDPRLEPGMSYGKTASSSTGTTQTPSVLFTKEMLLSAKGVSEKVNVDWFIGIPFDDPINWRLAIAEHAQEVLGDRLLGMQVANEPDFYVDFNRRPPPYGIPEYTAELQDLIDTIAQNDKIPRKNILIGPSTSGQIEGFRADDVLDAGWLDRFQSHLFGVTVEHYGQANCDANYGGPNPKNPEHYHRIYLDHDYIHALIEHYHRIQAEAQRYNKPLMMFETNTASCGGFMGISNSFTSALFGLDYGFTLAFSNFTYGLLHVGGQNVYYNPFTAPRTEHSAFNDWTVGPIFYSVLIIHEAFGKSNTARITDLWPNNRYAGTPAYAIYENDVLSKVALFNMVSDATGASDITASLTVDGQVPTSVRVKYLLAPSVVDKDNITWAGQTFGNSYHADGILRGELNITTINCDVAANVCRVPVPAPGFALVFFNTEDPVLSVSQASTTFTTTAWLKNINTATYSRGALETSNGHKNAANNPNYARTNFEYRKLNAGEGLRVPGVTTLVGLVFAIVGSFVGARLVV